MHCANCGAASVLSVHCAVETRNALWLVGITRNELEKPLPLPPPRNVVAGPLDGGRRLLPRLVRHTSPWQAGCVKAFPQREKKDSFLFYNVLIFCIVLRDHLKDKVFQLKTTLILQTLLKQLAVCIFFVDILQKQENIVSV